MLRRFLVRRWIPMVLLLAHPVARGDSLLEPPHGFRADDIFCFDPGVPFELQLSALTYTPDGDLIVYENGVVRVQRDGADSVLARFDPAVFGSVLRVTPAGDVVLFAESSTANIHAISLAGDGVSIFDNQAFNFDLSFAPAGTPAVGGRALISALGPTQNGIFLLDGDPDVPNDEIVTNIPVFSGPLTFDAAGNLYYATAGAAFEGEFGQRLVRFTPEQLAAGVGEDALEFAEGEVLARDLGGLFGLEPFSDKFYATDLGFGGAPAILAIDPADDFAVSVFLPLTPGHSPSLLAVFEGDGSFEAGSGPEGGKMAVAYSDFTTLSKVAEISPELFFVRGRVNSDDDVNLADAVALLRYMFQGGAPPVPLMAGDIDADGRINLGDAVFLLEFLFRDGRPIPPPYPDPGPAPTS